MLSAPISFSTELCVLGPFLVATTPTGICAVLFGEDTVALEDDLAQRFASATRIREDNDALLGQVAAFIASPRGGIEATLDMQGVTGVAAVGISAGSPGQPLLEALGFHRDYLAMTWR